MAEQPAVFVIDANVVLKLFFEQPGSDKVDALFALLESDTKTRFFVPDFFYAECASAFTTYARHTDHTTHDARGDMEDLLALALRVIPTAELATEALDISIAQGISGYAAFYVALSERMNAPLVTADGKLVRALAGKGFQVCDLARLAVSPPAGT
jgi:predicted nucleic acid-binding protein